MCILLRIYCVNFIVFQKLIKWNQVGLCYGKMERLLGLMTRFSFLNKERQKICFIGFLFFISMYQPSPLYINHPLLGMVNQFLDVGHKCWNP